MGKKLSTPEVYSELEAAQKHHRRGLQEHAEALSRLVAYKKLRVEEIKKAHSFRRNARIKEIYQECAEALGMPVNQVRRQMNSVEALSQNLPKTRVLYQQGETDLISVQKVNRAVEGISHRPELLEKVDGELTTKARELNSAELDNWLNQRVPQLDIKAHEERYERAKHKHYVAFDNQSDGTTKLHGLISTVAAARIEQMLYSMARNMPRKASTTESDEPGEERTHTQRMADIFTTALTAGLQGAPAGGLPTGTAPLSAETLEVNPIPGSSRTGAAKIGILIPVKTLTGQSEDPAISWDRTWVLPACEARAIAADTNAKHDWYAVGITQDAEADASADLGEVVTVTKARTAPASTASQDIDAWVGKTDPQTNNLLTKTYESRTARDHQRNAVLIRDGQCQTPGCTESGWAAEIDHKQSYETGGATTGENLQTLRKTCHDIKSHKHHPPDPTDSGNHSTQARALDEEVWINEYGEPEHPDWLRPTSPPPDWAVDDAA